MSASFRQNLLHARSHIAMILGLLAAFGLVSWLELWDLPVAGQNPLELRFHHEQIPQPAAAPLSSEQRQWAQTAWRYFDNNYQAETGLVNSVDNYPATTLWDTASYLLALISAYRLELISPHVFDTRMSQALTSLGRLELFDGELPNKSYNTQTLAVVDYNNQASPRGIGWSAIDLGRVVVPLHLIAWHYPRHAEAAQRVLRRWQWHKLSEAGQMQGALIDATDHTQYVQEGRLGYEQYAAKALALLGLDVSVAGRYTAFLQFQPQYGIEVPTDSRDARTLGAHNYVVSEPYILDGLEFGGDYVSREFAWRVYQVQAQHAARSGRLTAVSEDHLDQAPYFVYNTVFVNGEFWRAISDTGEDLEKFKTLSVKAAFGWDALYRTDYTGQLMAAVKTLNDPARGWYSGLYDATGQPNKAVTANTNAIVLESLYYRQFGNLLESVH